MNKDQPKSQSALKKPQDTQYLFIDMNAFFASCEQQTQPNLRHKPVAVTPYNGDTGCIISPSYEAKAYGVKTGTLVRNAKFLCPNINILEANVSKYLGFHDKLKQILYSFSPFIQIMSIDEAVIKLSPSEQNSKIAKIISCAIKQAIYDKLGFYMRSSIGIGPNIYLSKQAAELHKPDGLTEIKIADLETYYQSIKLRDLKGINCRMEANLNYLGYVKPINLYHATKEELRKKMGIIGEYWYLNLHGYGLVTHQFALPKSIGQSHVLEPKYRNWTSAWAVTQKLAERAGKRLREENLIAQGVGFYLQCLDKYCYHKGMKTSQFSDSFTFLKHLKFFWKKVEKNHLPLKIGVRLFNLSKPWARQNHLLPIDNKSEQIYTAIDEINDKYGSFTIKPANILQALDSAPNRIAFGKPLTE